MEEPKSLSDSISETVAYAPEVHIYPTSTTNTITTVTPASDMEEQLQEDLAHGTLERLVKPEDVNYEIPSEDVEEKDQQPLGIVESCFPYLARRGNGHHARPHQGHSKNPFGFYPGMKSCFVSVGLMEEDGCICTKAKSYEGDATAHAMEPLDHAHEGNKSIEDRPLTTVD